MKTERFEMRMDRETLENVDTWRADQPDLPSRAEAVAAAGRCCPGRIGEGGQ